MATATSLSTTSSTTPASTTVSEAQRSSASESTEVSWGTTSAAPLSSSAVSESTTPSSVKVTQSETTTLVVPLSSTTAESTTLSSGKVTQSETTTPALPLTSTAVNDSATVPTAEVTQTTTTTTGVYSPSSLATNSATGDGTNDFTGEVQTTTSTPVTTGSSSVTSARTTSTAEHVFTTDSSSKTSHRTTTVPILNNTVVTYNGTTEFPGLVNGTAETVSPESQCDSTTIAIIAGASGGFLLLVLLFSIFCFVRQRSKWRTKLDAEKSRTNVWPMSDFNNTIINENFADYELAKPDGESEGSKPAKSIGVISPTPAINPFASNSDSRPWSTSQSEPFNSEIVNVIRISDSLRREMSHHEKSKIRRNTYSAPDALGALKKAARRSESRPESTLSNDLTEEFRDRAITFTAGKKHKTDRHVLLRHEEIIEDDIIETLGGDIVHDPEATSYVTEL